eukprot:534539-Amphidinium_carterae.1
MLLAGMVAAGMLRLFSIELVRCGVCVMRQDLDTANGGKPAILNVFSLPHMESICRESVQA